MLCFNTLRLLSSYLCETVSGLSWSNRAGLSGAAAETTFVWGLPCKSTCQTRRQVKTVASLSGYYMVQLNDKLGWLHFVAFQCLNYFVAKICSLVPVWNLWCFVDHPRSSVVYNFGRFFMYVCQMITFKSLDVGSSYMHIPYIRVQFSYMKVIESRSRSHQHKTSHVILQPLRFSQSMTTTAQTAHALRCQGGSM